MNDDFIVRIFLGVVIVVLLITAPIWFPFWLIGSIGKWWNREI